MFSSILTIFKHQLIHEALLRFPKILLKNIYIYLNRIIIHVTEICMYVNVYLHVCMCVRVSMCANKYMDLSMYDNVHV